MQDDEQFTHIVCELIEFLNRVSTPNYNSKKRKFDVKDVDEKVYLPRVKIFSDNSDAQPKLILDRIAPDSTCQTCQYVSNSEILENIMPLVKYEDSDIKMRAIRSRADKAQKLIMSMPTAYDIDSEGTISTNSKNIILFLMKLFATRESKNFLEDYFNMKASLDTAEESLTNSIANNLYEKYRNLHADISVIDIQSIHYLNSTLLDSTVYKQIEEKCLPMLSKGIVS